jgi:hypothetical protein
MPSTWVDEDACAAEQNMDNARTILIADQMDERRI